MAFQKSFTLKEFLSSCANELLLYSGQYALFYILMNFSRDGLFYFKDTGHTLLLLVLVVQTVCLVFLGEKGWGRFSGSLIAPLFYTMIEFKLDLLFITNIAHLMFWVFSLMTAVIQTVQLKIRKTAVKKIIEFSITVLNVLIFLFMYFYFDLDLNLSEKLQQGGITLTDYAEKLHYHNFSESLGIFLSDSGHIFIIAGGLLLAVSLGAGRIKVIELTERIRRLFGKYVDDSIRDRILREGRGISEKMDLAVLFVDIRNFTTISENRPPEEITSMLNLYFSRIARIIQDHGGIIDKYIGDAAMAVFGLKDRMNACSPAFQSSQEILNAMKTIREDLMSKNLPVMEGVRIGIHYGPVIAGDIGSEERVNYTFIGDTVNTASRLESYGRELGSSFLVSDEFYRRLQKTEQQNFIPVEKPVVVKGKEKPVTVYRYASDH